MPTSAVLDRRLTPVGWNRAVEYRGFCPWESAYAGHSRNQVNKDESPQPHVVTVVGLLVHTCHQTVSETNR
jgi:hypothetical protein